ncbi:unnamed protein product [Lathyrus sativus]|nr:unnamed protein product [Lathyrus sativus]
MEKSVATENRSESNEHLLDTAITLLDDLSSSISELQLDALVTPLTNPASHDSIGSSSADDDWEAKADCEPDKLLSPVSSEVLSRVSDLKLENTKSPTPKRRGRGTFSYDNDKLYSDRLLDGSIIDDVEDEETRSGSEDKKVQYGTSHVLVLSHFSPSTRTTDLEKVFDDIKNCHFVIRWVNDTVALAVFRTPAEALEAQSNARCSFNMTMKILGEEDAHLSSIKPNDLKPPQQRQKTSVAAAQRMIANSMGIKLPSPSRGTGFQQHKREENTRKERIVNRQKLKEDAWGED